MKVLIVEDEELAVKNCKNPGGGGWDRRSGGIADSIKSSVEWLEQNPQPDLYWWILNWATGSFEIFNLTEVKCPVISPHFFTMSFAPRAFKVKQRGLPVKTHPERKIAGGWKNLKDEQPAM